MYPKVYCSCYLFVVLIITFFMKIKTCHASAKAYYYMGFFLFENSDSEPLAHLMAFSKFPGLAGDRKNVL